MIAITDRKATEQGSFPIALTIRDADDLPVVPNTLTWSLVDKNGNIQNGKVDQPILPPVADFVVVPKGNDLVIQESESSQEHVSRYVIIEGDYDSTYGSGLPFKRQVVFVLENLKKVS